MVSQERKKAKEIGTKEEIAAKRTRVGCAKQVVHSCDALMNDDHGGDR